MSLIYSEEDVREFLDFFLSNLEEDEVALAILVSRKKYESALPRSNELLDYVILRGSTERMFRKLKKFAYVEGVYTEDGYEIPKNALALYVDVIPKSSRRASLKLISEELRLHEEFSHLAYSGDASEMLRSLWNFTKIRSRVFSCLARSPTKRLDHKYLLIDLDKKSMSFLTRCLETINKHTEVLWVTETRGGYHIITRFEGKLIPTLREMENVEFSHKQAMTPLCGTLQGGFPIKRILRRV